MDAESGRAGPVMPADGRLRGRVGLITGAASGIGAAGTELFAVPGRHRRRPASKALPKERTRSGRASISPAMITRPAASQARAIQSE